VIARERGRLPFRRGAVRPRPLAGYRSAVLWVQVALLNVIDRATSGQWFRWFSRRTLRPLFLPAIPSFGLSWAGWASYPGPNNGGLPSSGATAWNMER
jgi:hypothetical protein